MYCRYYIEAFYFTFYILCCKNTVLKVRLGLGANKARKGSCKGNMISLEQKSHLATRPNSKHIVHFCVAVSLAHIK